MYAADSYLTLPGAGQAGLAILSALLAVAAGAAVLAFKTAGLRIIAALAAFWIFLWLSPQIYYFYYLIILDGLALQLVIAWPPSPLALVDLLLFRGPATLAGHGQAVLGWALLGLGPLAAWRKRITK